MNTRVYACYNKYKENRNEASSGGIYASLAELVLRNNGVVFAVCYDENFETIHTEITTLEMLSQSFGSKYIPSKLNDTFNKVKCYLKKGREVLFVGTPCQCSGLLSFLQKKYENLICVDLVCHGVPSKLAWRKYLEKINENGDLKQINMRDKSSGWSKYSYSWKLEYINDRIVYIPQTDVSYMRGFVNDFYLRPSCYKCKFKGIERSTDITLGDFWGVWDLYPEMNDDLGTSLILVHSEKGRKVFESIRDNLYYKEAEIHKAVKYNLSIIKCAKSNKKRKKFYKDIESDKKFEKIIDDLMKESFGEKIKKKTYGILKGMLFRY